MRLRKDGNNYSNLRDFGLLFFREKNSFFNEGDD